MAVCVAVILLLSSFDFVRRPTFRRLALRNAMRRKNEALLVVLGSLFGTAIVTSAFVVGDTLNASIRDEARTRLGPIDEIVLVHRTSELPTALRRVTGQPLPSSDGAMPLVTTEATVSTFPAAGQSRVVEPQAFVHELDFDAARRFGHRPADTGLADAGPTPKGSEAVIGVDLASRLHVRVGDQLVVFVFGQHRRFRVRTIVPRVGLAGFVPGSATESEVAFVPPGTLNAMASKLPSGAQAAEGRVLVSNQGGVYDGVGASDAVSLELQIRTAGLAGIEIISEKQGTLDYAKQQGSSFTELFGLIGGFTVVAGVLLLVNIFVMLAEERKSELGMLRAIGLKRNHLVRTFGLEGNLYSLVSAALGAFAGIAVGRVVVNVTERIFSSGDHKTALRFDVRPASLLLGSAIGLAISVLTVWGTSFRIGRLNVIRAIRDAPEAPRRSRPWRALVLGAVGVVVGGQVLSLGIEGHQPVLALLGPALGAWAAVPLFQRFVPRRQAVSIPCVALLVYSVGAFTFLPSVF
ncbi:MAG TPA: ABC transporter permease, partial [Acidimicrobiales bacterium]|nr:ABC transporter permease [Acidimicrobiales bacterium]